MGQIIVPKKRILIAKKALQNLKRGVFTIFAFQFLSGCGHKTTQVVPPLDPVKVTEELQYLTEEQPQLEPLLKAEVVQAPKAFRVIAYVDHSQSMQAFFREKNKGDLFSSSDFAKLLRGLSDQSEFESFVKFGTNRDHVNEIVSLGRKMPVGPAEYNLINNDYASVIKDLISKKDPNTIFLLITDGVQSSQELLSGSIMGPTAKAIHEWLDKGGALDVRILTAPYRGKYFSEELRSRGQPYTLEVETKVRPFVVLAFIPDTALFGAWDSLLKRERLAGLGWKASYRLPQRTSSSTTVFKPVNTVLSKSESASLGLVERKNEPFLNFKQLDALDPPWWGEHIFFGAINERALRTRLQKSLGSVPVDFEINPEISPLPKKDADLAELIKQTRANIQVYKYHPAPSGVNLTKNSENNNLTALAPRWSLVQDRDLRFETIVFGGGNMIRVLIPWDGTQKQAVFLTTFGAPESVTKPDFSKWSTLDDSTTESMDRILNLQTLIEQVTSDETKASVRNGDALLLSPVLTTENIK